MKRQRAVCSMCGFAAVEGIAYRPPRHVAGTPLPIRTVCLDDCQAEINRLRLDGFDVVGVFDL